MATIRNVYNTLPVISPYYINIEKSDIASGIIIVTDVVNNNEPGEIYLELKDDVIWLKINVDHQIDVMSEEPTEKTAFSPAIEILDKTRLRLKTAELFAVEYDDPEKDDTTQRTAVTGYQMGTYDVLYVKIDQINDVITVYSAD